MYHTSPNKLIISSAQTHGSDSYTTHVKVERAVSRGESLFSVCSSLLSQLKPDIILTQNVCSVCSIDDQTVTRIIETLDHPPIIISLNPTSLSDIFGNILEVGDAIDQQVAAKRVHQKRMQQISATTKIADESISNLGSVKQRVR